MPSFRRFRDAFRRLRKAVKARLPYVRRREYRIDFELRDAPFSSRVVSDGTLRVLALLTMLFDPQHRGLVTTRCTASLDAGCGFGGPLLAGCFTPDGALADSIEA